MLQITTRQRSHQLVSNHAVARRVLRIVGTAVTVEFVRRTRIFKIKVWGL
jgi:hypothetical protein